MADPRATVLLTSTGPVTVNPQPDTVTLTKLKAAIAALTIAAGSAVTALQLAPAPVPGAAAGCVLAEEVWYSSGDTLLWVPVHGAPERDSIVKLEALPDTKSGPAPVQVCTQPAGSSTAVPARPVWSAGGAVAWLFRRG